MYEAAIWIFITIMSIGVVGAILEAIADAGSCRANGCGHEVLGNDGRCALCRKRL